MNLEHTPKVGDIWKTRGGALVEVTREGYFPNTVRYGSLGGGEIAVFSATGKTHGGAKQSLEDLVERVHESPKALRGQLDEVPALAGRALDALQSLARLVPECKVGERVTTDLPQKLTAKVEQMQSELLECAALAMAPFPVHGPVRPGDALYAVRRLREVRLGECRQEVLDKVRAAAGLAPDDGVCLVEHVREMSKRLESQAATIAAYQTENVSLHESVSRGQVAYARACDELASLRSLVASQSRALARWTFSG